MPSSLPQPLKITTRHEDGTLRMLVVGDLDRQSAWALTAAIIHSGPDPASRVLVDLSGLIFIDAGGLRALADVARRVRRQGRSFAIARPSRPVARLLHLTGVDQTFDIVEDTPHAAA